jgi:PAS domain S-box-containing protein
VDAGDQALRWFEQLWARRAVGGLVEAGLLDVREDGEVLEPDLAGVGALPGGRPDQGLADAHAALGDVLAASALRARAPVSLDEVVARSRHPVMLTDDDRRITDVNAAAISILRADRGELLGRRLDDLLPDGARERIADRWADLLAGEERSSRCRLVLPDGEEILIWASFMPRVAPGVNLLVAHARDSLGRPAPVLRPREREVIGLVATGATSADIAARLVLSPATVESHIRNAVMRLGARNRTHASVLALQRGEIALRPPPPPPEPAPVED